MKGKCLECANYYLVMKFRVSGQQEAAATAEVYGCTSPDIISANVPGGHPFKLDTEGLNVEMLECNDFELKEKEVDDPKTS